jgi:TolA-binding protein
MLRTLRFLPVLMLLATLTLHAQDTRENAEFKLAVGLFNDGLLSQAEDQFRVFIDKFPTTSLGIESRFYLGLIQLRTGKTADARATFQDFAIRYSDHVRAPEAWWKLGEAFAAERNWAEAASAYARLKTFHPKDKRAPQALLEAVACFRRAGDDDNARLTLNAILTEYPQSAEANAANLELAELLLVAGDLERAQREFTRVQASAAASDEMKARATVGLGRAHLMLGNREEAEKRFNDVTLKYPKTVAMLDAQTGLGDLNRQFRAVDKALESYQRVATNRQAPVAARQRAWTGAAETAREAGRVQDAARMYDSLFTLSTASALEPSIVLKAADAARAAGDIPAAIRRLRTLLEDSLAAGVHRQAIIRLAEASRAGKRPGDAIQAYQTFLARYPADEAAPWALLAIGDVTEHAFGNLTRAAEVYGAVLDRYGTSAVADRAQFGQARTYEVAGRYGAAADAYQQVWRQFPASPLAAEARKKHNDIVRFQRGTADEALPLVAEALGALRSGGASQSSVDLALGRLYLESLKDHAAALASFQSALRGDLPPADAERARWGRAMAALRLVQRGEGSRTEAEQFLAEIVGEGGTGKDDAAYQLFLLRSEGRSPQEIRTAAESYRASGATARRAEVELAAADAARLSGAHGAADTLASAIIASYPGTASATSALAVRGSARAARGDFQRAIADFRAYEREAPDGERAADALLALGRVLVRTGLYTEAASTYETLADRFPYSPLADTARLAELGALSEGGVHDRAMAFAASMLVRAERNPFFSADVRAAYLFAHATVHARAKQSVAARRSLQRYVDEHPAGANIGDVYFALGQMFKDEGKLSLATAYFQQAGALGSSPTARMEAADLLLESGRFAEAAAAYDVIAREAEGRIERSYALSRSVVALYRSDKSEDAARRAADFRAQYADAQPVFDEFEIERGKLLFRQKQFKKAAEVFDDMRDSKTPAIAAFGLYWLGRCDEAQNQDAAAEKKWNEVAAKHAGTEAAIEAQLSLARMAMRGERYEVAATAYKSVADAPRVSQEALKQALNGLISCYEELKFYDAAIEMTRRFLDTWPNDVTAFRKRVNLGVFYYQLRYFDQAVTHFQSLLANATPDDQAEIRYYIGESYFYKQDFTQAALEFLKVPYLVTTKTEIDWSASAYYMAGQSYEKLGKYQQTLEMYERIITTPGYDPRFKAQAEKERDRVRGLIK